MKIWRGGKWSEDQELGTPTLLEVGGVAGRQKKVKILMKATFILRRRC